MKRYNFVPTADPHDDVLRGIKQSGGMEEIQDGHWVRYSDALAALENLRERAAKEINDARFSVEPTDLRSLRDRIKALPLEQEEKP